MLISVYVSNEITFIDKICYHYISFKHVIDIFENPMALLCPILGKNQFYNDHNINSKSTRSIDVSFRHIHC